MKSFWDISNAELEVMEMLWKQGGSIKQSELLALFEANGKKLKRQTLNTFLLRLEAKGMVKRDNGIVETIYSREEYRYTKMKAAVDCLYDGQLSDFVAAFTQKKEINEEEVKELIRILENI